jgi:hypothetical protein
VLLLDVVDLVFGRGVTDIVREIPLYFSIFEKYVGIKLLHQKPVMYGSVAIINVYLSATYLCVRGCDCDSEYIVSLYL